MRQGVKLREGQQFRAVLVVIADVVQRLADALLVLAAFVSTTRTGMPLMRKLMSVRMSGGVPLVNVNSSVTWKMLASGCAGSSSRTFRSRFSVSTKTVLQPLEVFPGSEVALDVRLHPAQRLGHVLGPALVHDAGVELLELLRPGRGTAPGWSGRAAGRRASSGERYVQPASTA